jgi:hypothetical protein
MPVLCHAVELVLQPTPFATVTLAVWPALLPAASNALTWIECGPFAAAVVSQAYVYGAAVSVAFSVPSTEKSTRETPTLSDADALTVCEPETVEPFAGAVREIVGAVVSAQADVEALIDARLEWLPAASIASTPIV